MKAYHLGLWPEFRYPIVDNRVCVYIFIFEGLTFNDNMKENGIRWARCCYLRTWNHIKVYSSSLFHVSSKQFRFLETSIRWRCRCTQENFQMKTILYRNLQTAHMSSVVVFFIKITVIVRYHCDPFSARYWKTISSIHTEPCATQIEYHACSRTVVWRHSCFLFRYHRTHFIIVLARNIYSWTMLYIVPDV